MLALYISEALNCSNSRVFSVTNPIPINCPEFVYGDSVPVNLYVVDGQGDYSDISGQAGTTVKVGIGDLSSADPAWLNASWTRIANGWTGSIAPRGVQALLDLFLGRQFFWASLRINISDPAGHPRNYAVLPFKLLRIGISEGAAVTPPDISMNGQFAIPNGADQVIVTGLALPAVPRRVIAGVRKASGGANLFSSLVDGSVTADGFTVDLDGQTDSADYILDYVIFF